MVPKSRVIKLCIFVAIIASLLTCAGIFFFTPLGKALSVALLVERKFYKPVEMGKLLEGASRGVVAALGDPYSVYMNNKEWQEFQIRTSGHYSGIGVTIGVRDGRVVISQPMKGTPAEEAGLKANDVILKVDGKSVSTTDEAALLIRGPAGTTVTLTLLRDGKMFDVSVVRREITVPAVNYSMVEKDIGYIELFSFNEQAYVQTARAVSDLKAQGAKAIILDLRNNGGGYLDQCRAIAELFVPEGPLVTLQQRSGPSQTFTTRGPGLGLPLFVLVNEGTASASEILAGAIQDRGAGILIGVTTFGKGLVQGAFNLRDGSVVKLTTAEYLTPKGRAINGSGLEPDVKVEGDSQQMAKALELARAATHKAQ